MTFIESKIWWVQQQFVGFHQHFFSSFIFALSIIAFYELLKCIMQNICVPNRLSAMNAFAHHWAKRCSPFFHSHCWNIHIMNSPQNRKKITILFVFHRNKGIHFARKTNKMLVNFSHSNKCTTRFIRVSEWVSEWVNECNAQHKYTNKSIHFINSTIVLVLRGLKIS